MSETTLMEIPFIDSVEPKIVADKLGCSPETLNELAANGEFPGFKYGRGWRYSAAATNVFLQLRALQNVKNLQSFATIYDLLGQVKQRGEAANESRLPDLNKVISVR